MSYDYNQPQYGGNYNQCPPPPGPQGGDIFTPNAYGHSRGVAGLLAIFLGSLGVQYFYLGKTVGGLLAILLTVVTCGIFSIIWLIQGIVMLTMTPANFDAKFENPNSTFPLL